MGRIRTWAAAWLVAAAALAHGAPAPEQIAWAHGLEAAQADAKARGVPLLVVLNMDGEPGNEAMLREVYAAPAVREAAKKCAVTIASMYRHEAVEDAATGRKVCSRFGRVTCDEHRATEGVLRRDWLKIGADDTIDSPHHEFRAPDGRPLFARTWTIDAPTLVKLIDRAVAACAPAELAAWDTTPGRLRRLTDPVDVVRDAAVVALLGPADPEVDAAVFEHVRKSGDADVAATVLWRVGAAMTPSRAEGVRKLLSAPSPAVRMHAAACAARRKEKETYDALAAAFAKEKQTDVRCVLLRALAGCGAEPAKARDLLLRTAKGGEGELRTHAAVGLAPWAAEDAVVGALRKTLVDEKSPESLRLAACWTLGLCGRKEVAEELRALAKEVVSKRFASAATAAAEKIAGNGDPNYLSWRRWIAPLEVAVPEDLP